MVQTAAVAVVGASSYYAGPIVVALKKVGFDDVKGQLTYKTNVHVLLVYIRRSCTVLSGARCKP
jgi:hypothetical protein